MHLTMTNYHVHAMKYYRYFDFEKKNAELTIPIFGRNKM